MHPSAYKEADGKLWQLMLSKRESFVDRTGKEGGKTGGLNCIDFSARNLTGKVVDLRVWIVSGDRDIIAITET